MITWAVFSCCSRRELSPTWKAPFPHGWARWGGLSQKLPLQSARSSLFENKMIKGSLPLIRHQTQLAPHPCSHPLPRVPLKEPPGVEAGRDTAQHSPHTFL